MLQCQKVFTTKNTESTEILIKKFFVVSAHFVVN